MGDDAIETANRIKNSCQEMAEHYKVLAEAGDEIYRTIETNIGLFYQYECTITYNAEGRPDAQRVVTYQDHEPFWWEKWSASLGGGTLTVNKIDHPRRKEALEKLEDIGINSIDPTDDKFDLDAQDIVKTVTGVGEFMGGWLHTLYALRAFTLPEHPLDIESSSSTYGWRSANAYAIYTRIVKLQFAAQDTVKHAILDMLNQNAQFLDSLRSHLVEFAALVRSQQNYYAGLATSDWIPDKGATIGWVIDSIGELGQKVVSYQEQQTAQADAMIEVLNQAVKSILDFERIRTAIDGMSRAGRPGWPMPVSFSSSDHAETSSEDSLIFETNYFKDHIEAWEKISDHLGGVANTAQKVKKIESMFERWTAFASDTVQSINSLGARIATELANGKKAAAEIAEKLEDTIRAYLATEELTTDLAKQLQEMLDR